MQFATNTGAQLPTSSIIILTEMFAFCLSVSHFHKQNGRKMMCAHYSRSSAQVKNAQAFLTVRSAEQPLAAPERVPFFSHSLGKQRMGRGVHCSAEIKQNFIKGARSPLSNQVQNYIQNKKGSNRSLSSNQVLNYSSRAQPENSLKAQPCRVQPCLSKDEYKQADRTKTT